MLLVATSTSAFYYEPSVIKGDSENLSKTVSSISVYTPLINENTEVFNKINSIAYINKPEIVDTKTREQIDKEKEESVKIAKTNIIIAKRNVVVRERSYTETEDVATEIQPEPKEGNSYYYGYCTWYVANRRSDVPNNWGNAKSWLNSAQSAGWPTGAEPQSGAIVVTKESWAGHVGYVESVNENTFTISEMNYNGWGRTNSRTIDKNSSIIKGFIY